MSQAINAYYRITASPEFREPERLREKASHDEAQALHHAEQKGLAKGRAEGISERSVEIEKTLVIVKILDLGGWAPSR